jgi:hypothetical protein
MGALTVSILLHGLLGSALACAVFTVGLGCVGRLPRGELFAYPPGLLLASLAAFLFLVEPWLAPVSALLLLVPLGLLARDAARAAAAVRSAAAPVAWSLLPGLGLALALGRLNHGPTETVESSAYGDMLFYAAKLVAATQSLFPFRDLTVAGEEHVFVETSWVFVGAALSGLPRFDPILFQACTAPAFLVTAVAIGVGLLLGRTVRSAPFALVGLLAVGVVAYPTWIAESPPVALAVPLGFAFYGLWRQPLPEAWLAAIAGLIALDLYLTKGFGLIPFGVVLTAVVFRDHRRRFAAFAVGVAVAAVAGAVVFALNSAWLLELVRLKFLPADAAEALWSQLETRSTQEAAPAAIVAGHVLLAAALWRARALLPLAVLLASMTGSWLVGGHGFDITIGLSVLVAAQWFAERPHELRRERLLVAGAAVALALASWFRDIAGARAGFVLVALLAAALALVFAPGARTAIVGAASAAALALALGLGERRTTLGPDAYAVWERVHDVVPEDGVVFTSLTGDVIAGDQGWNYYPGLSERQIYLAGWSNSPLLVDDGDRRRRLALNRRVLSGTIDPESIDTGEEHRSAFAVLRANERAPDSFGLLYRNDEFALYFIGGEGT